MRKPEGETEYAPNGGGNRRGDEGCDGGREGLCLVRHWALSLHGHFQSLDNALFARMKSLRFEIANCVWDM